MAVLQDITVRRELRPGDAERIVDLHDRIYSAEYGLDQRSRATVAQAVQRARDRGWPERAGAVWLIDGADGLDGSLALTHSNEVVGEVHWFVLAPALRGRGLGRALLAELLGEARVAGLERLELDTFSALTTAARLYREVGFRVVSEEQGDRWGPLLTFQYYGLSLR